MKIEIKKIIMVILGLPKSILVNFKYFSFKNAIKLPIIVSHTTQLKAIEGSIKINSEIKTGMIKFGFGELNIFERKNHNTVYIKGDISFKGKASFGKGTKLCIDKGGSISFGEDFCITAQSSIVCTNKIVFGDNVLISWENLIMDGDYHKVIDNEGNIINESKPIIIGNKVWIGCRCTILKGTEINDNSVIASNTVLTKSFKNKNCIIGKNPPIILKENINWEV